MPFRRPSDALLVLGLYVVPVLAAAGYLASAGLGVLAVALLAVEAVVAASVWAAKKEPRPRDTPRRSRPWLLPVVMLGALMGMVLLTVLAT
jgi:hypothetical protein